MRINRLYMLRYGRFTDVSLELPVHNPDVHVVFGPNEVGKSTALAAIEDVSSVSPQLATQFSS